MGLPREAIGPEGGPIASRGVSIPVFLRKPIANCDFPGLGVGRFRTPCPPSGSMHALTVLRSFKLLGLFKIQSCQAGDSANLFLKVYTTVYIIHDLGSEF